MDSDLIHSSNLMNWQFVIGILSTLAFIAPIVLILWYKLLINRSLLALLFYYTNAALYNLMSLGILVVPHDVKRTFGAINNYLDVPLIFLFFIFCTHVPWKKRIIGVTVIIFGIYEMLIAFFYGLSKTGMQFIIGPSVILILLCGISLFFEQVKMVIYNLKGPEKALMAAAIAFAYGTYAQLYYFYYINNTAAVKEVFLIFFVASILSSVIMCLGLYWLNKKCQKFQEVQLARKELATFFGYNLKIKAV